MISLQIRMDHIKLEMAELGSPNKRYIIAFRLDEDQMEHQYITY